MENSQAWLIPPKDDRQFLTWLENQPSGRQREFARQKLDVCFENAAQPRHVSGNACIKLCYFIEQCKNSKSASLQSFAFSETTILDLFSFYTEWNEKNQNRSMRQVLELISTLISRNPESSTAAVIRTSIVQRNISIITHHAAQPLVKPAFRSSECLLSKGTLSKDDFIKAYHTQIHPPSASVALLDEKALETSWDSFFSEIFDWMTYPDISPAAGKFLVALFRELRELPVASEKQLNDNTASWQRWIRRALSKDTQILEHIKNYLFPPLFKLDRPGSLAFLQDLNRENSAFDFQNQEMDSQSLLQLAAIEVGKKSGLVEEPNVIQTQRPSKKTSATITMKEDAIGLLLVHSSDTVRSLAFSVLVSSSSPIRPFSTTVLEVFRSSMAVLYSDVDAKFRNETLSNTKQMIERLRGATAFLVREIESLSFQYKHHLPESEEQRPQHLQALKTATELLESHEKFIEWYVGFLLRELTHTAAYQRHITSLKAILLLLQSGILKQESSSQALRLSDNSTIWPYTIEFFTPLAVRTLMDLLLDPFEDVRDNATAVLKLAAPIHFTFKPEESLDSVLRFKPLLNTGPLEPAEPLSFSASEVGPSEVNNESKSVPTGDVEPLQLLTDFKNRAAEAANLTGRADYADGVAHSYELLYTLQSSVSARIGLLAQLVEDLERRVAVAEKNLGVAVIEAPIHGSCAALNYVWEVIYFENEAVDIRKQLDTLQVRIVSCCSRIWDAVKEVLCNDSPEGHLPQDLDEADDIDTKDVLSYSFRAVHEASNLLRVLLHKISVQISVVDSTSQAHCLQLFTQIGNLTFSQLSTLRHRGAFSTVSLTFVVVCKLTQNSFWVDPSAKTLLHKWYQGALSCLDEQTSTTRRSAGIPALITAIISANGHNPTPENIISELKVRAVQPVNPDAPQLPQVHAINSLREILKSSTLGKRSEHLITDCLEISTGCLDSQVWAIRNVGLLLLRSLIDVLFGTSDSKASIEAGWDGNSIRLSYDKYPGLQRLLFKLLSSGPPTKRNSTAVESVIPALDIIRRAGPPPTDQSAIIDLVYLHLGSPSWIVRELAANTMASLSMRENWIKAASNLLKKALADTNHQHGALMAVKAIVDRQGLDNSDELSTIIDAYKTISSLATTANYTGFSHLAAAYAEVHNSLLLLMLQRSSTHPRMPLPIAIDPICNSATVAIDNNPELIYSTLGRAAICQGVLVSAIKEDTTELQSVIDRAINIDPSVVEAALGSIIEAWVSSCTQKSRLGVCKVVISVIRRATTPDLKAKAITTFLQILRSKASHVSIESGEIYETVLQAADSMLLDETSPSLTNAWLELDGLLHLACLHADIGEGDEVNLSQMNELIGLAKWLSTNLGVKSAYDSRKAVAYSLLDFFGNEFTASLPDCDPLLVLLFVLYDVLNDDDSDIRSIGARAVSGLIHKSVCPLQAREELAKYLLNKYKRSTVFTINLVIRITGNSGIFSDDSTLSIDNVGTQLLNAVQEGDENTLFAEEDQNLYIDQVRERQLWLRIFKSLPADSVVSYSQEIAIFLDWIIDGLKGMGSKLDAVAWVKVMAKKFKTNWASLQKISAITTELIACAASILIYDQMSVQTSQFPVLFGEKDRWETKVVEITRALGEVYREWKFHDILHDPLYRRKDQLLCAETKTLLEAVEWRRQSQGIQRLGIMVNTFN